MCHQDGILLLNAVEEGWENKRSSKISGAVSCISLCCYLQVNMILRMRSGRSQLEPPSGSVAEHELRLVKRPPRRERGNEAKDASHKSRLFGCLCTGHFEYIVLKA